jgi:hypothetical protein
MTTTHATKSPYLTAPIRDGLASIVARIEPRTPAEFRAIAWVRNAAAHRANRAPRVAIVAPALPAPSAATR